MDLLGWIFIAIFLTTFLYPNFIFLRGLKNTPKKNYKYKAIYFFTSLITSCSIVFIIAIIIASLDSIEIINFKLGVYNNYISRIIFGVAIFPPSILINIHIAKLYLKRISKTKNEIELIGEE